jgi:hypothetical protein
MYEEVVHEAAVDEYPWDVYHPLDSDSTTQLRVKTGTDKWVGSGEGYGFKAPYRVLRKDVYRVSATQMRDQRENGLYYVDLPAVGYGPSDLLNVTPEEPFSFGGRYQVDGYRLAVQNACFTFSAEEEVRISLPPTFLPAGFSPGEGKEISIPERTVKIRYDYAPTVDDVQAFLGSPLDRPQAASVLARHFAPAYVLLEVEYEGGSAPEVLAPDLLRYLANIPPQSNRIQVDAVVQCLQRRQTIRVKLPVTLLALVHGLDRKIVTLRSQDFIGAGMTPHFEGTFAQMVFIPGPDTSSLATRPDGEQIYLKRGS